MSACLCICLSGICCGAAVASDGTYDFEDLLFESSEYSILLRAAREVVSAEELGIKQEAASERSLNFDSYFRYNQEILLRRANGAERTLWQEQFQITNYLKHHESMYYYIDYVGFEIVQKWSSGPYIFLLCNMDDSVILIRIRNELDGMYAKLNVVERYASGGRTARFAALFRHPDNNIISVCFHSHGG